MIVLYPYKLIRRWTSIVRPLSKSLRCTTTHQSFLIGLRCIKLATFMCFYARYRHFSTEVLNIDVEGNVICLNSKRLPTVTGLRPFIGKCIMYVGLSTRSFNASIVNATGGICKIFSRKRDKKPRQF